MIVWIDDYPHIMGLTAEGILPKLWSKGINSQIFFFGNNYKNSLSISDFGAERCEMFMDELARIASENGYCTYKNGELIHANGMSVRINGSVKILHLTPAENKVKITTEWKDISPEGDEVMRLLAITDQAINELDAVHYVVAIDMLLIWGDENLLADKNSQKPILSMVLYNYFVKKNIGCFIYSSNTFNELLGRNWKEKYSTYFKDTSLSENFKIYARDNFFANRFSQDEFNELLKLIHK